LETNPIRTIFYARWFRLSAPGSALPVLVLHPRRAGRSARQGVPKWKQSLRTTARAEALKKARQLAVEHDRLIDEVRKPFVERFSTLSAADRERIESSGGLDLYLKFLDQRALESRRNIDQADTLHEWAADVGPSDEIPDPDWAAGKAAALLAEQRTIDAQIARDAPMLRQLGLDDARLRQRKHNFLADALASGIIDPKSITLSGVLEKWKECKAPSAPEQYAYPVRLFEELHGAIPIRQVETDHVREFRDGLSKMPRAGGSPMAGLTLQQRLERAEKENLPRLDESTAVKYFRSLKTLFKFAASEAYLRCPQAPYARVAGLVRPTDRERDGNTATDDDGRTEWLGSSPSWPHTRTARGASSARRRRCLGLPLPSSCRLRRGQRPFYEQSSTASTRSFPSRRNYKSCLNSFERGDGAHRPLAREARYSTSTSSSDLSQMRLRPIDLLGDWLCAGAEVLLAPVLPVVGGVVPTKLLPPAMCMGSRI
jgi:hypothetical protein